MAQLIVKRSDGGVSIGPAGENPEELVARLEADPTWVARGWAAVSWRASDSPVQLPNDGRVFRDAWTDDLPGEQIDADMPKARNIHMDRIREKRNAKLAELDRDYMRADEDNDGPGKAAIAQQKRKLRDLPATYDLSVHTSPDTLKDDWPPEVL